MKKLLIASVLLFSNSAHAFSWFNISGNWVMDRGETKIKVVQNDKNINVYMADNKMNGTITLKLIKKFNFYAISKQRVGECMLTSMIDVNGEMQATDTLAIEYCRFSVSDSCYPEQKLEYDCGHDVWTKK